MGVHRGRRQRRNLDGYPKVLLGNWRYTVQWPTGSAPAGVTVASIVFLGLVGFGSHLLLGERAFRGRAAHLSGRIVAAVYQAGVCDSDPSWTI